MSQTYNHVQMNHSSLMPSIIQNIRFNNPHTCVLIHRISESIIPMNKCTTVLDAVHLNGEEEPCMSNAQSEHAQLVFVNVNENTIILGFATSPGSNNMHMLMAHATSPTYITGCIEGSNGQRININLVRYVKW